MSLGDYGRDLFGGDLLELPVLAHGYAVEIEPANSLPPTVSAALHNIGVEVVAADASGKLSFWM